MGGRPVFPRPHTVDERVRRVEFLASLFHIGANRGHLRLRFAAGAALETPAAEQQDAGLAAASAHGHHGVGVVRIAELTLEDFSPEVVLFVRHVLQAQATVRAEIVIRDELVRLVGALLFLGAFERFRDDDFVFFVELFCVPAGL